MAVFFLFFVFLITGRRPPGCFFRRSRCSRRCSHCRDNCHHRYKSLWHWPLLQRRHFRNCIFYLLFPFFKVLLMINLIRQSYPGGKGWLLQFEGRDLYNSGKRIKPDPLCKGNARNTHRQPVYECAAVFQMRLLLPYQIKIPAA